MALTAFEEIRARRGRRAVLAGLALWFIAIASSVFVGIATGLFTLLVIEFPLQELAGTVGADPDDGGTFAIGWWLTVLAALVGFPLAILAADRLGAWAMRAEKADPDDPADRRIEQAIRTVALAAGVDPLVLIVDARWIDGAALGKRGPNDVVMVSRGAADLDDGNLALLAAAVLADSVAGGGAARARVGASAPGLIPFLFVTRVVGWVWRRPRIALGGLVAWVAVWSLTIASSAADSGSDVEVGPGAILAPVMVLFFTAFATFLSAILLGIFLAWSALLAAMALPIAARARKVADIGMASLVRAPEEWVDFFMTAAARDPHPPAWSRMLIGWVLPRDTSAAQRRVSHLAQEVPAGMAALGHMVDAPPPTNDAPAPPTLRGR